MVLKMYVVKREKNIDRSTLQKSMVYHCFRHDSNALASLKKRMAIVCSRRVSSLLPLSGLSVAVIELHVRQSALQSLLVVVSVEV